MSTTPTSNPTGPFIVTKDGQREGNSFTNESEAQAAAQQLRTLLESRQGAPQPVRVEVKRQING